MTATLFTYSVPINDPALPGHFPGNPVVPAVVILNKVRDALKKIDFTYEIEKINKSKFIDILRPSEVFSIEIKEKKDNLFEYSCVKSTGALFASGEIKIGKINNAE